MINTLTLTNLGKFIQRRFDLANVTVFLGKNEAGKSTIFHALFGGLCSGGGASKLEIQRRYGVDIDDAVDLEPAVENLRIPVSILKNLFAIHTNDLSIGFDDSKSWIEKVRANLFTGGIDPRRLANGLEQKYGERSTLLFNKTMKGLEDDRKEIAQTLEDLKQRRSQILAQEQHAAGKAGELELVIAANEKLQERIEEIDRVVNQQRLIQERKQWKELETDLTNRQKLEELLKQLDLFASDNSSEATALQQQIGGFDDQISTHRIELGLKSTDRDARVLALNQMNSEFISKKSIAQKAREFISDFDRSRPLPRIRSVTKWNVPLLVLGVVSAIAGAGGAILSAPLEWMIVCAVSGLVLGGICVLLSKRSVELEELPDLILWCASIRERWAVETHSARLNSTTPEALRQEFQNVVNECEMQQKRIQELEEIGISASREIAFLEKAIRDGENARRIVDGKYSDWLKGYSVTDLDAYQAKRGEYQKTAENIGNTIEKIEDGCREVGITPSDDLGAVGKEKIYEYNRNIQDRELPARDLQNLVSQLNALKQQQKEAVETMGKLQTTVGEAKGKAIGALGRLPDEMAEAQMRVAGLEREIGDLKLEKAAAARVVEIWNEMASDATMMFSDLSQEMTKRFEGITQYDSGTGRSLTTISALSANDIEVQDSGGTKRPIADLSTATQDAFYLAARLTLALRVKEENKARVFLLDDPFLTLDEERTLNAIKLLKAFQEESGWQMVFFTKDRRTVDQLVAVFPELQLHDLDLTIQVTEP
jgi:ABC-type hemin transport system ATPase subunit/predicted phage tail protein